MSEATGTGTGTEKGTDSPGQTGESGQPTDAQLREMSQEELLELGGKLDGVEIVFKEPRWPVPGTKAEKRAERTVAYWLLLAGVSGLALLLIFLFWPWEYKPFGSEGEWLYALATPLYGLTFGLSVLSIGIGAVLFQKKFIPEEISIQDRHDGASPELHRRTVAANLGDALDGSTLKRRKLIGLSLGIGFGAFGLGTLVAFLGGLIKNPWKPVVPTAEGMKAVLWTSGWPVSLRSSRCARRTSTRAAWRPCSRGANPTATAPPSSPSTSSPRSRWVCATPSCSSVSGPATCRAW